MTATVTNWRDNETTQELRWRSTPGPWCVEIGFEHGSYCAELSAGQRLVIGSSSRADLSAPDRTVSSRHCVLTCTSNGVGVEDLGSRNGTVVGDARAPQFLLPGEGGSFVVGRTVVTVTPGWEHLEEGEPPDVPGLVGRSRAMGPTLRAIHRFARLKAPVLLRGESGTGKDVVARAIHALSRRTGQYVPLNVGAIPEALADAELFGHVRGAFTGAAGSRSGAFEQAHHGTLLLDEIADLPPALQVKLLRVVEDGVVRPVGGVTSMQVNVRIVSATWASLEDRVKEGKFRLDLLHRLSVAAIELPPLRERRTDIPMLARALLRRHEPELGPRSLTSHALARLVRYSWPGNVRELGAVLYRAAACSSGTLIDADVLDVRKDPEPERSRAMSAEEAQQLLELHGGNLSAAARAARVPRSTFRGWLERSRSLRG